MGNVVSYEEVRFSQLIIITLNIQLLFFDGPQDTEAARQQRIQDTIKHRSLKLEEPSRPRDRASNAKLDRACYSAALKLSTPPRATPLLHRDLRQNTSTTAAMDTDMTDAAYDIDIDVGAGAEAVAQQPQQVIEVSFSGWVQGCIHSLLDG